MNNARISLKAVMLGSCALVALTAGPAAAEQFSVEAQDLRPALQKFASQGDQQVLFSNDVVAGKRTAGFNGDASPEVALQQLLAGTNLTYRRNGDTFLVVSAADPQSGSAAGDGADAGTVQALVVTAQKREENIQDVPIAMSAFSQESLTKSQIAGGADLMTQVPNMTFTKTNFTSYSIQIRGIGTQAISATTDPAVAVAFNNTPFLANHFFEQEFYDLERVEVLRGPQGTLYGRNATAGVVNIISAKPKNHYEAKLSGDLSNYNSSRFEGMINVPLVEDKAALRIAGAWTKRDGFVKNLLTDQQTDGRNLWSGRVTLGLTPTDKFTANLIYEHFEENDDRLRSGKQLCNKDLGPATVQGIPVKQTSDPLFAGPTAAAYWSQGCKPASLYSPDAFQTPNGYALPYYGAAQGLGAPVYGALDPYRSSVQSRNLREIETHIKPEYDASADTVELQLSLDIPQSLTLASETAFSHDRIFSFEDFNRFDTTPGVFRPGGSSGNRFDVIAADGTFCDPQLGCTNRLAVGDLAMAKSQQFSQEIRLSSEFDGPVNFSLGVNFLRYDTEVKYFVFINSLTAFAAGPAGAFGDQLPWEPGVTDGTGCIARGSPWYPIGLPWSDPNKGYTLEYCFYIDPNNIHNLNDQGRNYFLSKNPYHLLSYAAFGELYWQVTPDLKVTGGLRWTVDRKTAPQIPSWLLAANTYGTPTRKVIEQQWREPTGRLAIDWKPRLSFTDETLLYASYVRGYKAGGANPPPLIPVFPPVGGIDNGSDLSNAIIQDLLTHPETFEPEFVNAYEGGAKNTLLGGRLTVDADVFYYDYTGYQISEIVDRSALNLNFDAKVWGAELEAEWRLMENLQIGFKGGYEDTRLAKGSRSIDLMDRTAGNPNYLVKRPFPTFSSNCIVPAEHALQVRCEDYKLGQNPYNVPNNGAGIFKDLSGNKLPNAPKFTATVTANYTLPLPNDWLMTFHTDLYYQSEAWTRVFNDPGYDKLKAFNNVNVATIFSNQDRGWQIMAYVKNVQNKDNITGAFLNSDDTSLTTNVFLTEPRLYGIRVTKNWTGDAGPLGDLLGRHAPGQPYPFRVELGGSYGPFSGEHEAFSPPTVALFPAAFSFPLWAQGDLDWGSAGEVKLTYQPSENGWSLAANMRYGRAVSHVVAHKEKLAASGPVRTEFVFIYNGNHYVFGNSSTPTYQDYANISSDNHEEHKLVDFTVGHDVGLGIMGPLVRSTVDLGVRYIDLRSGESMDLRGRPDLIYPDVITHLIDLDNYIFTGTSVPFHRVHGTAQMEREFAGGGLIADWKSAIHLTGREDDSGAISADVGLGGGVLWGRQTAKVTGNVQGEHVDMTNDNLDLTPPYNTPFDYHRTRRASVPTANASLGLSYEVGRVKISSGYKWERYFNALDGGVATRKTYDRNLDGAYFKVSVGFGG